VKVVDFENGSSESLLAQMWHRKGRKICKKKVNEVEDKQEEA
jgi:hypothetical protein